MQFKLRSDDLDHPLRIGAKYVMTHTQYVKASATGIYILNWVHFNCVLYCNIFTTTNGNL